MKLTGFAFGIRTVRSFSVEDRLGAIVDEILYSDKSEFNEKIFPEVRDNHNTKLLFDPIKHNKFTVTPQDFIFEYNVDKNFENEFDLLLKNFKLIIINKVFDDFKIKNIQRYGFIVKTELEENDKFLNEISSVIEKHKGSDDSISLRFNVVTKKPLKIAEMITEDYDNEIVTYDRPNAESALSFSVDYQKYFKPELNIIADATTTFDNFCNNSLAAFKKTYLGK
jgi:hypothetical protein